MASSKAPLATNEQASIAPSAQAASPSSAPPSPPPPRVPSKDKLSSLPSSTSPTRKSQERHSKEHVSTSSASHERTASGSSANAQQRKQHQHQQQQRLLQQHQREQLKQMHHQQHSAQQPTRTFVNGRGNAQPIGTNASTGAAAAASYGAAAVRSNTKRSDGLGSSTHSVSNSGASTSSSAAPATKTTMSFPSAFGVRQKMTVRRTSASKPPIVMNLATAPPAAPAAPQPTSLAAPTPRRPSATSSTGSDLIPHDVSPSSDSSHANLSAGESSRRVSKGRAREEDDFAPPRVPPQRTVSPSVLDRPRPKTPEFSSFGNREGEPLASRPRRPTPSPTNSSPGAKTERGSLPPSPASKPPRSIMDRPRPQTPDPYDDIVDDYSGDDVDLEVTPPEPQAPAKVSIMDRPRPKTPDPFDSAHFSSSHSNDSMRLFAPLNVTKKFSPPSVSGHRSTGSEGAASMLTSSESASSSLHARGASVDLLNSSRPLNRSVMDRGRPRTPDADQMFASVAPSRAAPAMISTDSRARSHTPDTFAASSYLPSSSSSSLASSVPASSTYATSISTPGTNVFAQQRRFASAQAAPAHGKGTVAPLLQLDLDLGQSDTMFDLAGILSGVSSSPISAIAPAPHGIGALTSREPAATRSEDAPQRRRRPSKLDLDADDDHDDDLADTTLNVSRLTMYSDPSEGAQTPLATTFRHSTESPKTPTAAAVLKAAESPSREGAVGDSSSPIDTTELCYASQSATSLVSMGSDAGAFSFDKSLPPTPPRSNVSIATTDSGSSGTNKVPGMFRRISRLRERSNGSSDHSSAGTDSTTHQAAPQSQHQHSAGAFMRRLPKRSDSLSSGFQLISATTTRVPKFRKGSSTSTTTVEQPVQPATPVIRRMVPDSNKPSLGPSSASTARTQGESDGDVSLTFESDTATGQSPQQPSLPSGARGRWPKPPRRGSFSGLLDKATGGGAKATEKKGKPSGVLGMSLGGARRSEDLLRSAAAHETDDGDVADDDADASVRAGRPLPGRRSLDMLASFRPSSPAQASPPAKKPRRKGSTDKLLSLATGRIPGMGSSSRSTTPVISQPQLQPSAPLEQHQRAPGDLPSPDAVIMSAARVSRSNSVSSATRVPPPSTALEHPSGTTGRVQVALIKPERATEPAPQATKPRKAPDYGAHGEPILGRIWTELDESRASYNKALASDRADRAQILSNKVLPWILDEEVEPTPLHQGPLATRQRDILFGWLGVLVRELQTMQPAHRGICLEAVFAIVQSHFFSDANLVHDEASRSRYRSAIVNIVAFAVDKLNEKAVYANTLVFAGRVFALAFFRIEGVGLKLLRALPPIKRLCVRRLMIEAGLEDNNIPPAELDRFPEHLRPLCLKNARDYISTFIPLQPRQPTEDDRWLVRDGEVAVEMSGNWLIRWTASDSDLPFAFYRAYHRQLAMCYQDLDPVAEDEPRRPSEMLTAPGFLYLASSLLDKCDSLIHRNLRSVTSINANAANFNTNDSANLAIGQKPKVLEVANRRLVSTMLDIAGGPPSTSPPAVDRAARVELRRYMYGGVLQAWLRACVKRTSMWDTRSVFILLDLVEGLIYTLSYPPPPARESEGEEVIVPKPAEACLEMFDISFIFLFVKKIFLEADNTVAIMRTIAFVYAHFEIFTMRAKDRDALCETVILDKDVFSRMYLHWNAGVRGYFIRLLVWRLARLGVTADDGGGHRPVSSRNPRILAIFGLMNARLEAIRRRHDELEPATNLTEDDDLFFHPKRSTICSTVGVKEAPFTVDEISGLEVYREDVDDDAVSLGSRGRASPLPGSASSLSKDSGNVKGFLSKLKVGLRSGKRTGAVPDAIITPFSYHSDDGESDAGNSSVHAPTEYDDAVSAFSDAASVSDNDAHHDSGGAQEADYELGDDGSRVQQVVSPSFFSFEFEGGGMPRSDEFDPDTTRSPASPSAATARMGSPSPPPSLGRGSPALVRATSPPPPRSPPPASTPSAAAEEDSRYAQLDQLAITPNGPAPRRRKISSQSRPTSSHSPRVSVRFSKRASILPPAALDLLKDLGEAVPPIPDRFIVEHRISYDRRLHPYAVRGLRDYEDALDEWTDWVTRLQEEEANGKKHSKGFIDVVPRLQVGWPQTFETD